MAKKTRVAAKRRDQRIEFDRDDFEVLEIALNQVPELRICAGILKAAKTAKVRYPINSLKPLIDLLPSKEVFVEGHSLRPALIDRYMRKEYLPIGNDQELIARCYLALMRCREDVTWAVHAPSYAAELIDALPGVAQQKGKD